MCKQEKANNLFAMQWAKEYLAIHHVGAWATPNQLELAPHRSLLLTPPHFKSFKKYHR
jgi:hypothetical protein